jgi:hypothetical protein
VSPILSWRFDPTVERAGGAGQSLLFAHLFLVPSDLKAMTPFDNIVKYRAVGQEDEVAETMMQESAGSMLTCWWWAAMAIRTCVNCCRAARPIESRVVRLSAC